MLTFFHAIVVHACVLVLVRLCFQAHILPELEKEVEGMVNFELMQDLFDKSRNRGFGFLTLKDQETCKAAHAKYYKDNLKIMVRRGRREREKEGCDVEFDVLF